MHISIQKKPTSGIPVFVKSLGRNRAGEWETMFIYDLLIPKEPHPEEISDYP